MRPPRLSALRAASLRARRAVARWCGRAALWLSPLGLATASDGTVTDAAPACEVAGARVEIIEGSRLLHGRRERLDLVRGRVLGCEHPHARRVLAGVAAALPLGGSDRPQPGERLPEPVRVHVDPRLPAPQAPLAGIEVHVTTREVLVTSRALPALDGAAWRHELLHVLAAPPPDLTPMSRRLWLTLEEGVVEYLARQRPPERGAGFAVPRPVQGAPGSLAPPPLPALEWLASPAYDPHPLARGLARELHRVEPHATLERWLSCLSVAPSMSGGGRGSDGLSRAEAAPSGTGPGAIASVFGLFTSRCSPDTASTLSAAIERWWVTPHPEPEPLGQSAPRTARASTAPRLSSDLDRAPGEAGVQGRVSARPAPHGLMTQSLQLFEPR